MLYLKDQKSCIWCFPFLLLSFPLFIQVFPLETCSVMHSSWVRLLYFIFQARYVIERSWPTYILAYLAVITCCVDYNPKTAGGILLNTPVVFV